MTRIRIKEKSFLTEEQFSKVMDTKSISICLPDFTCIVAAKVKRVTDDDKGLYFETYSKDTIALYTRTAKVFDEEYDSMTVRVGKLMYEIGYGD